MSGEKIFFLINIFHVFSWIFSWFLQNIFCFFSADMFLETLYTESDIFFVNMKRVWICKSGCSLGLGCISALLFIISSQPYIPLGAGYGPDGWRAPVTPYGGSYCLPRFTFSIMACSSSSVSASLVLFRNAMRSFICRSPMERFANVWLTIASSLERKKAHMIHNGVVFHVRS